MGSWKSKGESQGFYFGICNLSRFCLPLSAKLYLSGLSLVCKTLNLAEAVER